MRSSFNQSMKTHLLTMILFEYIIKLSCCRSQKLNKELRFHWCTFYTINHFAVLNHLSLHSQSSSTWTTPLLQTSVCVAQNHLQHCFPQRCVSVEHFSFLCLPTLQKKWSGPCVWAGIWSPHVSFLSSVSASTGGQADVHTDRTVERSLAAWPPEQRLLVWQALLLCDCDTVWLLKQGNTNRVLSSI